MATTTLEIEIEVSGTVQPGERTTHNDPGHDAFVDDLEIDDITASVIETSAYKSPTRKRIWKSVSLLDGVDIKNPEVRKLLSNLLEIVAEDAEELILADAA